MVFHKLKNVSLALLLIRIGLAAVFIIHGWQKISAIDQTLGFISSLGFPVFMGYVVTFVEFIGGIALLLGIFARWAGFLLAIDMAFAIYLVTWPKGFTGYEFNLLLLLCGLSIALAGPGKYSIRS